MKELKLPEGKHFINLTLDLAFKMVFGDSRNIDILKSLLIHILGLNEDDLQDIKLISEFLNRENENDYKGIIDIRIELKDETQIQIEMQVVNQHNMDKRSLYYWSGMYYTQLEKSESYGKLCKCVSINILAFNYEKINRPYSRYVLKEYETNEILNEMLDIRFIELPKRGEIADGDLKKWLDLIASKTFEEMVEIARGDEQMERVVSETYKINSDKDIRVDLERREKFYKDQINIKEEGKLEEKRETIFTLKDMGMSLAQISKAVRLAEKEVEAILKDKKPNSINSLPTYES